MRMRRLGYILLVALSIGAFTASSSRAQTPVEAIKGFSDFQTIDLSRLLDGDVLSERGSLMNFPNGISGQTCYAVSSSAAETAKRLQAWDPSPHADLQVYAFRSLHVPCELADFQQLDFRSNQRPVRWLLERTAATTAANSELNLTRDEAKALAVCTENRRDPQEVARCWAKLLLNRASQFQHNGLAGVLPYETAANTVSPATQLRTMLLEQLQIVREFAPILKKIGLLGNETSPSLTPSYYWTLFDADHRATLALGAVYQLGVGDHYQLADVGYYVSNGYYTSATLYEVWPIQAGEKSGALVWRGDYFAAPMLAFTKGVERIAYGALMLQGIKKEIRCFQDSLKAKQ
jgi:hypothetical protein